MAIEWEADDSWFDGYELELTRAFLVHQDMAVDSPHLAPMAWWIVTGRHRYRRLTTQVRRCDLCETLCHVADIFEPVLLSN